MKPATVLRAAGVFVALALGGTQLLGSPIVITGLDPTNITTQGGVPQWTSGSIDLTSFNVSIGPSYSPLQLDLFLTGEVTTATDPNTNYGAWITLNPDVAPGAEIFGFIYQLVDAGAPVGVPFGYDLLNPFGFSVGSVGTGTGGTPSGVAFDEVQVTVYNTTLDESVSSFQAYIGVPSSIPDTTSTLFLLTTATAGLLAVGRRLKSSVRT